MHKPSKMVISDRDKILKRIFKMFINKGLYENNEYHDFCQFAKGKGEATLLMEI